MKNFQKSMLSAAVILGFCCAIFAAEKVVRYEDFGAKGDGKTCDFDALIAAHDYANKHNLPVRANDDATYYFSGAAKTITVQTDTDWGKAKFIIDDRKLQHHKSSVFRVASRKKSYPLKGLTTLKRNQPKIDMTFAEPSLILVYNDAVKHYIRKGRNKNNGSTQRDVFIVDKNGNVDPNAPIIWDFDQITSGTVYPIDETTLTVKGGIFTTIANASTDKNRYVERNLQITRSNTVVENVTHLITGKGKQGYAYVGFINPKNCAYVTVKDCKLTAHIFFYIIGRVGAVVASGTYDISAACAQNVKFINCEQLNDINDPALWGIMASNFCKNLQLENCKFSRFDAHQGVANATIRNSILGRQGINAIGTGTLLVENSTVYNDSFINLRNDYGSTWEGKFVIRNCVHEPRSYGSALIRGENTGDHDFGYPCYMPEEIIFENLLIKDGKFKEEKKYKGPVIFSNFNKAFKDASFTEKYPYAKTKRVILKNVRTESGKPLRLSDNMVMFKDVEVIYEKGDSGK